MKKLFSKIKNYCLSLWGLALSFLFVKVSWAQNYNFTDVEPIALYGSPAPTNILPKIILFISIPLIIIAFIIGLIIILVKRKKKKKKMEDVVKKDNV